MRRRFILAPANPNLEPPMPRRNFLSRVLAFAAGGALLGPASRAIAAPSATTDGDAWIGELAIVAFNFAPIGWALCDGQLLPISQYLALFSLLGTQFGGNGQTTFALPDLRGRVPIHQGQGPGLPSFIIGQPGGELNHTLLTTEMPAHTHTLLGDSANGTSDSPSGMHVARNPAGIPAYGAGAGAPMAANAISTSGGTQPHNNLQPYLTLNFIIALQGIFPSRS